MHFDFTISVPTIVSFVLTVGAMWLRFERRMNRYLQEHEMLVQDYCKRHGIKVSDLPTRFSLAAWLKN